MKMRGRSFKLAQPAFIAFVMTMLLLSTYPQTRAYNSGMEIGGAVPDIPGAGIITGIGVVFLFRQLTDSKIAFTSTILGFSESRGANITYLWDFGDNTTKSTKKNPIHEYEYSGWNANYNTTLKVCTERGRCAELYQNTHIIRWTWVYLTIGTILIAGIISTLYITKRRRKGG